MSEMLLGELRAAPMITPPARSFYERVVGIVARLSCLTAFLLFVLLVIAIAAGEAFLPRRRRGVTGRSAMQIARAW